MTAKKRPPRKPAQPKKPRGRPDTYTPEIAAELCTRVLTRSLRAVCLDEDMPAEGTVYGWMKAHAAFAEEYARARAIRAYRRAEDIDEVVQEVRDGKLEPNAGRVAIDAMKWQAGKEAPRVFGERIAHEHQGTLTLEQLVAGATAAKPDASDEG